MPPFHSNANEVIARTLNLEATSAEVARSVLKDLGLVSQILRLANSALYNRSGKPILSVSHAITLLGWENLRNLVTAVRYLEHYAKGSPGLRELMFLSLLTANHGREVAHAIGYPRPDEAYVCSLFRNLGEVLVACHYPKEYAAIILAVVDEKLADRAACLRILNYSYEELGARIAESWDMPGKIRLCLEGTLRNGATAADRCLVSVANCGHEMTRAIYRQGGDIESIKLDALVDMAGRRPRIGIAELRAILTAAEEEAGKTMAVFQMGVERLRLDQQARGASRVAEAAPVFDKTAIESLDSVVQSISRSLVSGDFELNHIIQTLLDNMHLAGFDRVVFALVDEERTAIQGRLGSGESAAAFVNEFHLPMTAGANAPWQKSADLLVGKVDPGAGDYEPALAAFSPGSFCLLPIIIDGAVGGCLYADRATPAPGLEAARWAVARTRDLIARAIRRKASRGG